MTPAELLAWRLARGWSLGDMADATGYDRGQLQRWETGERGGGEVIPLHVQRTTELLDRIAELEKAQARSV